MNRRLHIISYSASHFQFFEQINQEQEKKNFVENLNTN